jgi:hypothetical protein
MCASMNAARSRSRTGRNTTLSPLSMVGLLRAFPIAIVLLRPSAQRLGTSALGVRREMDGRRMTCSPRRNRRSSSGSRPSVRGRTPTRAVRCRLRPADVHPTVRATASTPPATSTAPTRRRSRRWRRRVARSTAPRGAAGHLGGDHCYRPPSCDRGSGPRTRLISRARTAASRARPSTTTSESPVPPSSSRLTSESSPR